MKRNILRTSRRGFTLIELMIVVAIIGIIGSIALPRFDMALVNAYQASAKGNLGTIRTTIGLYYSDQEGRYPFQDFGDNVFVFASDSGDSLSQVLAPKYIPKLPTPVLRDRFSDVASIAGLLYDETSKSYMESSTPVWDVILCPNNHEMQDGAFRPFGYDQRNGYIFIWNNHYDLRGDRFDSW